MEALISIITLTYNSKNLKPTIDSVLKQNYSRIQYIISDDHSQNLDLNLWKKYIENNQKDNIEELLVLESEYNQGIIKNLNRAIKKCKGKYIFFCSHDDELFDENVITDWVKEFTRTNADLICGKRAIFDEKMEKLIAYAPSNKEIEYFKGDSSELFESLSIHKNFIFGASTARTRESLKKYGYYDERYGNIEDYPAVLKISRLGGKITYFDRIVLKYRSGGISSKVSEKYLKEEELIVRNEILPYTKYPKKVLRKHRDFILISELNNEKSKLIEEYGSQSIVVKLYKLYTWIRHPFLKIRSRLG